MSRFKIDPNFNILWTCTYIGRPTDDDDDDDDSDENFSYDELDAVYILHCCSLSLISYFLLL